MTWEELKKRGSGYYKGGVEPIDLYKSGGLLKPFALASIIKYAYRNRAEGVPVSIRDMDKIKHYADMLIVLAQEEIPVIKIAEITDDDRVLDSIETRFKSGL
jgi:hypothetical protein